MALAISLPLFFAACAVVIITEGRPIFYGQRRRGLGNREFKCWKIRTMVRNGDDVLRDHLASNPEAAQEWMLTQKLRDDPRVTSFGRWLRRTSLDELPQLWNVIIGEMSLIGPRPIVDAEVYRYGRSYRYYMSARPGITGLWQVLGRSDTTYENRVAFDREYVARWSFTRDVYIVVATIPAVLLQRGSY